MILNGLLNLLLLFFVIVAVKKRPYVAAMLFASVKALIVFFLSREQASRAHQYLAVQIGIAAFVGCLCAAIATVLMYFMSRLSRSKDEIAEKTPTYTVGGSEKMSFRWEVIPLVVLLGVLVVI